MAIATPIGLSWPHTNRQLLGVASHLLSQECKQLFLCHVYQGSPIQVLKPGKINDGLGDQLPWRRSHPAPSCWLGRTSQISYS